MGIVGSQKTTNRIFWGGLVIDFLKMILGNWENIKEGVFNNSS